MSKQLNTRIPKLTKQQLEDLGWWTGMTQTQIVLVAMDRIHQDYKRKQAEK